ncbi:integrin alpha [Halobaculum litoreum]|uniref:integrin alpha n=1 Tax=Halobaculum litoreum TaxID=3031998 RepID=UPI0024C2A53C|nr:integrin alpha [Halobaculum sp. DT92]
MVRLDHATAVVVAVTLLAVVAPVAGAVAPSGPGPGVRGGDDRDDEHRDDGHRDDGCGGRERARSPDAGTVAPDRRGVLTGRTDLGDADTRVNATGDGDRLGRAVAGVGDVNGDGEADLLVGAPRNDSRARNAGAVYLFYGPVDRGEVDADDADLVLYGVDTEDRAGAALAGRDVDGDGYSDLVIGAPGDDAGGTDSGAVYVVYGGESLSGERRITTAAGVRLAGAGAGDEAGDAVAVVGAGRDDDADAGGGVAVGAPGANTSAGNASGAVYVVDLRDGPTDRRSLADADATFLGEDDNDVAGVAVAAVGDVDDDGREELAVGAPGADARRANATNDGAVYVLSDVFSGASGASTRPTRG